MIWEPAELLRVNGSRDYTLHLFIISSHNLKILLFRSSPACVLAIIKCFSYPTASVIVSTTVKNVRQRLTVAVRVVLSIRQVQHLRCFPYPQHMAYSPQRSCSCSLSLRSNTRQAFESCLISRERRRPHSSTVMLPIPSSLSPSNSRP